MKLVSSDYGEGGNPEVELNICVQKAFEKKRKCLERLFPSKPSILLVPEADGQRILLAGRAESVDRREITIKGEEILLLNIDISNVQAPLSSNIKTTKYYRMQNSLVLSIPVEDIHTKVTLKDKEGNIVLDYTIIKE